MEVIDRAYRVTVKAFLRVWAPRSAWPWPAPLVDHVGRVLRQAEGVSYRPVRLPNCTATWYTPANADPGRYVLYLHGGAFYVGGHYLHRNLVGRIANLMAAPVLAVNYRKLPRHTIADAVDDCLAGYRYLLENGVPADRITIMGDSAGGFLSLVLGSNVARRGLPQPGAIVAMSPLTNLDPAEKLASPTSRTCAIFPVAALVSFFELFERLRGESVLTPAESDLEGFPPTLIQAGRREYLYPDSVLMARLLGDAGRHCELQTWDTAVHVFQGMAGLTFEANEAINQITEFVDRQVPRFEQRIAQ